ncbi:MAG TPA: DUF885 domain-containing protein [Candidatus Saccharimonadales bacterium]|nr:DUF885 domain-containing protein [Candidatus Saccharimonadales bacterium]
MAEASGDEGSPDGLDAVLEAVVADQFRAHPALARANGDHSVDGLVAPVGKAAQDARVLELLRFRGLLAGDAAAADAERQLDLEIARSVVDSELFDLQVRQRWLKDPTALLDSESPLEIGGYLLRDYAPLPDRLAGLCSQLEQAREWTEEALAAMNPELATPLIELTLQGAEGHLNFLRRDVAAVGKEIGDTSLRSRLAAAVSAGEESLVWVMAEVERRRQQDLQEVALGAAGLQAMLLAQEGLDLSVSELRQQADQELESLREQRDRLLRDSFEGRDIAAVREQLEADHFTEGGLIAGASGLLRELREFVERDGEVPIPDGPPCEVRATPGFLTAWVSAAYEGVGPLETAPLPCIYYVTTPQPGWSQTQVDEWLRYLNRGTLKNTSVHEVYPGHHVQHLYAQSLRADVRRFFWTSGFGEGWAHYAELLMIEAGLGEGHPLLQLAQIEDALLRACRYRTTIGIHAEGWTVEEGTRLFMDRIGVDQLPAHREAARATIDPLYLVYTLGKLQILSWRKEWLSSNRGDLRSFHRRVLGAGSPPLAALGRWLHSQ